MTVKETFARILKELREKEGLNQKQLADELGISRGSISYYENEQRIPDIEVLSKIADHFKVTTEYLLGRSPNKTKESAAIGQELGLSDDAIYYIKMLADGSKAADFYFKKELILLNALLESDEISEILMSLVLSRKLIVQEINYLKNKENAFSSQLLYPEELDTNSDMIVNSNYFDMSRFKVFEAQEYLKDFAQKYMKAELDEYSELYVQSDSYLMSEFNKNRGE